MENFEWIDDAFRVEERKWGTWDSYDRDGKSIITSLTKENCINATRWYLKQKQEGFSETEIKYESFVGGKL
jgi:hypothetical protein